MQEHHSFVIVIHTAEEGGYWAEVPALSGCFVQGESVEDVLADAPGAISAHLEALRAEGIDMSRQEPIVIATVTVSAAA